MRFVETRLKGAWIIEAEPHVDDRGSFARTFCAREFKEHGLLDQFVQCNVSNNPKAGTLRGLHYEIPPAADVKLVRCSRGAICDVIVDLRPEASTFGEHLVVELSAENRRSLYVPPMFAHGFQTLVDDAEVLYQMGAFYDSGKANGLRADDPALGIKWPLRVSAISERDKAWPLWRPETPR